eukprot:13867051-Ditylum_brightwellii.AAC.1
MVSCGGVGLTSSTKYFLAVGGVSAITSVFGRLGGLAIIIGTVGATGTVGVGTVGVTSVSSPGGGTVGIALPPTPALLPCPPYPFLFLPNHWLIRCLAAAATSGYNFRGQFLHRCFASLQYCGWCSHSQHNLGG